MAKTRTLAAQTPKKIGSKVRLLGWINTRRDHGKLVFVDLRDRSGIVQVVGDKAFGDLKVGDVVAIEGQVVKRPANLVNSKIATGKIEVAARKVKVLVQSLELPFDMGAPDLPVSLPTLLDFRALTLRHYKVAAIFKVQQTIISSFRKTLQAADFTEIQVPTIVPTKTEGGAEIFKIDYYGYDAYLAQSPQLYKQILVGVFERVFTLAHAYRAEPSETTRHLAEYVSLDAEVGFIDSWEEILEIVEKIFLNLASDLEKTCKAELEIFGAKQPKIKKPIPKIKLREAQEIIFEMTKRDNRGEPDLSPEDEKDICQWSKEKFGSDFVFITHFPASTRPFYTYPDPKDPNLTLSFDLLGKGLELVTGGQRINDYKLLVDKIKKIGEVPENFETYLQAFKFGMPPEGGFAIGAERVTTVVLGLENIRQASLFPRDMTRIDLPLTKLTSKK